jgi:hypothetical protein
VLFAGFAFNAEAEIRSFLFRLDKTSSWSADHPVSFRDDLTRFRSSRQDRRVRQRCREGRRAAMPVLTNFVIV